MATTEELKALAAQLACPTGEQGYSIAKMMEETNIGMTQHTIQSLGLQSQEKLLEIGHGNAAHVSALLAQYPHVHYTGLELSPSMYDEAIKNNQRAVAEGSASFVHYDGQNLPFVTQQFDCIFSVNTLYFWPQAPMFLNKLAALLCKGGKIAIGFADKSFMVQLPFTAFGFKLYAIDEVLALADPKKLKHLCTSPGVEHVKNKLGETVKRKFYTVTWQKI